jgi:TP901 family phage tail tape measure protein
VASIGDLVVQLTADTGGFDKGIGGMVDKLGGLGAIGLAGAVAAAGAAIGAFVNASVEHVKALDNEMLKFQVNTGATADQAAVFSNQLRELYRGNTDSIDDLAAAATLVTQRFGEQDEALAATTQNFLDYAKVTGQDTTGAVDALADIMAKMNLDMGEGVEVMDALVAVAQKTGTPIEELQGALAASAGQFTAMGFSGTEAVAMLGALSAAGLDAGKMTVALNGFMKNTATLSDTQAEALEKLGVQLNTVHQATDKTVKAAKEHGIELRDGQVLTDEMRATLGELGIEFGSSSTLAGTHKEALGDMFSTLAGGTADVETMQAMMEIFGAKVGPELATAIATGAVSLDEFLTLVENSEGTVARASEVYDKQLGERWELLRRQYMEPFMNFIGEFFVAALHMIIDVVELVAARAEVAFNWILSTFRSMNLGMGGTGKDLQVALTAVFNAISTVVVAAFTLIVSTWENVLKPALDIMAPIFKAVFDSVRIVVEGAISVITSVLNALAALLTGDFAGAWEHIKDAISTVVDTIRSVVETIFDGIKQYLENVFEAVRDNAVTVFESIKDGVTAAIEGMQTNLRAIFDDLHAFFSEWLADVRDFFYRTWNNTKNSVIALVEELSTRLESVMDDLYAFLVRIWELIATSVLAKVEETKNNVTASFELLSTALQGVMDTLKAALERVWDGIRQAAAETWTGVANAVMNAFNAVPQFFTNLWQSIVNAGTEALGTVVGFINDLLNRWNSISFTIPEIGFDAVELFGQTIVPEFRVGGGTISVPQIPTLAGFAAGGLVRGPTIAMVGEAGPELITPLDRLGEFMGGGEQTIIVELDGRAIMQSVAPRMIDQIRLKTGFGNF